LVKAWESFDHEREVLYQKAEEKAQKALEKARREAEDIVASIRETKHGATLKEHEWIEARKRLDELHPELTRKDRASHRTEQNQATETLEVGDEVKVLTINQTGTVIDLVNEKEVQVQVGVMKMTAKKKDLQLLKRENPVIAQPLATVKGSSYHVKTELDLRGERYEDALQDLEKYIDDAILAGYPKVTIIHGKGPGALRKGVQEFAKRPSQVAQARSGGMNEGGSGVTIFELK